MSNTLLKVEGVETYYGNIRALAGVDVEVARGEIVCLIGANGAGKSTLMMTICGAPQARVGKVIFDDEDITRVPTHLIARRRIAQSPEGRRIFPRMTVLENLQMGAWLRRDTVTGKREMNETFERFPRLGERQHKLAGLLSCGVHQLLAINRALLSRPRLLILDEPSMGLAPKMVENIFAVIASLRERGVALLLIEQNARLALEVTDSAWVMDSGSIVHHGESKALLNDDQIAQIYLGEMPV